MSLVISPLLSHCHNFSISVPDIVYTHNSLTTFSHLFCNPINVLLSFRTFRLINKLFLDALPVDNQQMSLAGPYSFFIH